MSYGAISRIAVLVALAALPSVLCAYKQSDFTKSNASFSRKYEASESDLASRRSSMADKTFQTKLFTYENSASSLSSKRPNMGDGAAASGLSGKTDSMSGEMYKNIPDFSDAGKQWDKSGKELKTLDNLDRNLGKSYSGSIDLEKKSLFDTEQIQNSYNEMIDRSMGDINKYQYGASKMSSDEAKENVKVIEAGKKSDSESSIFDFLSSDKKIERPAVMLKGPAKTSSEAVRDLDTVVKTSGGGQAQPTAAVVPSAGVAAKTPAILNGGTPQVGSTTIDKKTGQRKVLKGVTEIDNSLDILKIPENMRAGKATIKVEVKENDY